MSTATLAPEARRNVALFSASPNKGDFEMFRRHDHATGKDVLVLKKVPVFRSGTFRDSMGIQHTWEDLHMSQMVDNFDHLITSTGIMAGAPVRKGHNGFFDSGTDIMEGLLGWHTGLSTEVRRNPVDGQSYTYLLADYDLLDPDCFSKIESGLWKSLSSEVGSWVSNAEAEYWPVYQGVAYVDFPAVEGLSRFKSANGVGTKFSIMEEIPVGATDTTQPGQTATPPVPPLPPAPPAAQPAGQTTDHAAAPVKSDQCVHHALAFSVNGQQTSDFAAVQAHIAVLEAFQRETTEAGRKNFVAGLVTANKMLAANQADTEAWCLTLTTDQFEGYKKQWENAPVLPQLGVHAAGTSNHDGTQPAGTEPQAGDEKKVLEATIEAFRISGMTDEQIKVTPSFRKLQSLQTAA